MTTTYWEKKKICSKGKESKLARDQFGGMTQEQNNFQSNKLNHSKNMHLAIRTKKKDVVLPFFWGGG